MDPAPVPSPEEIRRIQLENRMKSGANWFIWIGALSLVNSIMIHCGGEFGFIVGLGLTMVVDGLLQDMLLVAILLDILITGVFILFGILGGKGITALAITGMVLYALDGLIFVLVGEWLAVAFHVFALFGIIGGIRASFDLNRLKLPPAP